MDGDGLRPKQREKMPLLDVHAAKVQSTKVQYGFGIEKAMYIKRRRGRRPRVAQQDRKKKDNDVPVTFMNHVLKLCGHVVISYEVIQLSYT
jgi:hypothetical protein